MDSITNVGNSPTGGFDQHTWETTLQTLAFDRRLTNHSCYLNLAWIESLLWWISHMWWWISHVESTTLHLLSSIIYFIQVDHTSIHHEQQQYYSYMFNTVYFSYFITFFVYIFYTFEYYFIGFYSYYVIHPMPSFSRGAVGQVGTPKMGVTVERLERPKLPVERPVSQFKSPKLWNVWSHYISHTIYNL